MKHQSIIIADDHPLLLKGLSDFLIEKGYNVVGSGVDGREAYNLIAKLEPEIAILDIQMPFMSGIEIARKCNTNQFKTKIVLITFHKEKDLFQNELYFGFLVFRAGQFNNIKKIGIIHHEYVIVDLEIVGRELLATLIGNIDPKFSCYGNTPWVW